MAHREDDPIRQWVKHFVPWGFEEESSDEEEPADRPTMFPGASPALITLSSDSTMRKWNLKTGDCDRVFAGHDGAILACDIDFEGWLAVTGSVDNSLALWDVKNELWLGSLGAEQGVGHTGAVSDLSVDWATGRVLSCSYDYDLRTWDLEQGISTRAFREHKDPVCCLFTDWDAGHAASGSKDHTAKIWDLEAGVARLTLKGHTAPVWTVSCDIGDWRQALTGSMDRHVMLWDLRTAKCVKAYLRHEGAVTSSDVNWELNQAITTSCDWTVAHWDLLTGEITRRLTEHCGSVWCCNVDWKGQRMVSGAGPGDNDILLFDLFDGFCEVKLHGHDGSVWQVFVDWELAHRAKREMQEALKVDRDDYEDEDEEEQPKEASVEVPPEPTPLGGTVIEESIAEGGHEEPVEGQMDGEETVESPVAPVLPSNGAARRGSQSTVPTADWAKRGGRPA